MLRLPAALLVTGLCTAQGAVTFAPHYPMVHVTVHDLPGLIAAAEKTALGRLLADPEVAEAFDLGRQRYLEHTGRWLELLASLRGVSPRAITIGESAEIMLRAIAWRDIHGFAFSASLPGEDPDGFNPTVDTPNDFVEPLTTVTLHPTAAAEQRVQQHYQQFLTDLRKNVPYKRVTAPEQKVAGEPGLVLIPGGDSNPVGVDGIFGLAGTAPVWITSRPGLLAGGSGPDAIGSFRATEPQPPSFAFGVDITRYMTMMAAMIGGPAIQEFLQATGLDNAGLLEWRLTCVDDRVQDDLSLAFRGPIGGILGAMLTGMAPLPAQPLPEHGLLQVRCTFDVKALVAAVDRLLALGELRTLTEQGMLEDLRRAWTGGATLGLVRPAPGALVPRMYASFGIVDREALDRLLEKLQTQPFATAKQRELSGTECTVLEIDGLPSALQPAYCLLGDTIHFAESAQSLKALLKAAADDAPPALAVGDAPRPKAAGTMMPNFDLRFDGAEIHAAMQEIWLPLLALSMATMDTKPFVAMDEMPDVETVTDYLGKGRGVLRRTKGGITLSMSGTLGGPETHALAAMVGPVLSVGLTQNKVWELDALRSRVAGAKMLRTHESIKAYEKREGKRPPSLGALLAAGDLADKDLLLIAGDELAEPVMHEDKQVAKSSFRYYPEGLKISPDGNEVQGLLIAIKKGSWWRDAIDVDGQLHQGWNAFGEKSIDDLEKAARETGKHDHEHK